MLTSDHPSVSAGVTKATVGSAIDVSQRQQIIIQFIGTVTSGDADFSIDGSNDGTNWVKDIAFLDATSTTPTTLVLNKAISTTTQWGAAIVTPGWKYLRCVVDVTGTGTYYAFLHAGG